MTITPAANEKIEALCLEHNAVAVRPFVRGMGCSGMVHGLGFATEKHDRDRQITPYLIIDPVAYGFMNESTIDYDTTGLNPTFVFQDVFKGVGGTGMCGGCGGAQ